jgi:hypothetical protein
MRNARIKIALLKWLITIFIEVYSHNKAWVIYAKITYEYTVVRVPFTVNAQNRRKKVRIVIVTMNVTMRV